ncbi:MAG: zinc-ribbon domain-containing protein, partial [Acetobacter sp.]|nr:zinc-ribbon domain-containing protein [Acetobacter sp.]
MRIVCPSCGVAYQVPAALLAKRQTLKCSACGTKWHIHAQPEDPTPAPDLAPVAPAVGNGVAPQLAQEAKPVAPQEFGRETSPAPAPA